MNKNHLYSFLLFAAVLCTGTVFAQPKGGISSGASSSKKIDAVLGKPITGIITSGGSSVTLGLPFSELKKESITAYTGEQVTVHGITFIVPDTPEGEEGTATMYFAKVPGLKYYDLSLKIKILPCNSTVADADGNTYNEVPVAGYCWTKQNLRTTKYMNGNTVENAMKYTGMSDADMNSTYGRLYTWYSAVGLPEDGTGDIASVTSGGYVQGICPADWHVPTDEEMTALQAKTANELNSELHWVGPYAPFANTLKFTAEPAGKYNNALNRFEGLTTETGFWSAVPPASSTITTTTLMCIAYYCDVPFTKTVYLSDGYSVRCVKKK
jgi:uncharacterized protein (TIGR02145 family)